jgi:acyl-CoA reductase-like NAD-dependent aldehyde dehydrogenase
LAPSNDKRTNVRFAGPTAAITPWNFPFMMITRKVATALPAGCTMIIKPSEQTPLTAYKLLEYARKAGIPEGVFEMVTGNPKEIGKLFTGDTRIRKLPFTGSTAVGKLLASTCGKDLKRMTLKLGGNAPFIVFDDSDFETAVASRRGKAPELRPGVHLTEPILRAIRRFRSVCRSGHRLTRVCSCVS